MATTLYFKNTKKYTYLIQILKSGKYLSQITNFVPEHVPVANREQVADGPIKLENTDTLEQAFEVFGIPVQKESQFADTASLFLGPRIRVEFKNDEFIITDVVDNITIQQKIYVLCDKLTTVVKRCKKFADEDNYHITPFDLFGSNSTSSTSILLNDNTVASLKKFLNEFPDDAKLVYLDVNNNVERRVQIACDTDTQRKQNKVILTAGMLL